jgi:hypothetical protein
MSQESVCMALRGLVKGHAAVEHVTATGLNGWGARHVFRRTGDLRAAAALLGMKDLTAVARVVGALGPFGP